MVYGNMLEFRKLMCPKERSTINLSATREADVALMMKPVNVLKIPINEDQIKMPGLLIKLYQLYAQFQAWDKAIMIDE